MGRFYESEWPPYVPVAERRRQAAQKVAKMTKAGRKVSPVETEGRKIASTFWGEAWCTNLEAYSDYANRLPRGRSYVRNGSVVDLQIEAGCVHAKVSGSDLYTVDIKIKPLPKNKWEEIKTQCAGQIDSLVELLMGSISKSVMEIVTRKGEGLFPSPREISLSCSCPDWATMCKHVAATLYGVGARLDREPKLLFTLRGVDPTELIESAMTQPKAGKPRKGRVLDTDTLSSVFGVDIDMGGTSDGDSPAKTASLKKKTKTVKAAPAKKKSPKADKKKSAISKAAPVKTPTAAKTTAKKAAKTPKKAQKASTTATKPKTAARKKPISEKISNKKKS